MAKTPNKIVRALVSVRLMPTINEDEVPQQYSREGRLAYRLGYNDAILAMRDRVKVEGID